MYLNLEQRKQFEAHRKTMDKLIAKIANNPVEINAEVIDNPLSIRNWKPGSYAIDDVRMYENNPYKCVQAHDSTANETWNPTVASLWMQYHGTSKETARDWVKPTGAHDMYKVGEWMIWTDGKIYPCIQDTNYSPSEFAGAWGTPEEK